MIDSKYAMFLGPQLSGFKQIRRNVWNSRCPKCGDSEKHKKKKRFYIYQPSRKGLADFLSCACHNCGYHDFFGEFLKSHDEPLYHEYKMELFKEKGWTSNFDKREEAKARSTAQAAAVLERLSEVDEDAPEVEEVDWVRTLRTAPANHPVLQYAHTRLFPDSAYDILGWCDNFQEEFGNFSDIVEKRSLPSDPRLIIPIRNPDGELIALQGRAIGPSELRYITLKMEETASKVFGLDRLKPGLPTIVVEGPLDSLFLPNCIATADANLLAAGIGDILVPDKQMRNAELIKVIERMIDSGKYVALLEDDVFPFKDINAAIQGGWTPSQVLNVIIDSAKKGLAAQLQLSKLRRV
ncbi:DNA primase subunit [Delftia phage PhiW-14]|uniref:DNA primase subunit n=1 Tax=Delftia phage PhiW-14 TaxID=665032 RepID=C9DGJ9_BPW14|nr:DNA primase subunit [Delftia phage PhiW-14]ACV50250.1 DNA primase subunit [Delftia phage PhiW-14]